MHAALACLLFANMTLLTILVPGGPVENRDFSTMPKMAFVGFNVFLVSLGVVSILVAFWLMISTSAYAVVITLLLGVLYAIVYFIDLAGVFPKSGTPMSPALMGFEIVNANAAMFLIVFSGAQLLA